MAAMGNTGIRPIVFSTGQRKPPWSIPPASPSFTPSPPESPASRITSGTTASPLIWPSTCVPGWTSRRPPLSVIRLSMLFSSGVATSRQSVRRCGPPSRSIATCRLSGKAIRRTRSPICCGPPGRGFPARAERDGGRGAGDEMSRKPLPVWLPVVLILLLGFALRLYRIEGQPLSGDEAYSAVVWVQSSPATLLNSIALATTEPHPPLALLTLHYWARLAGDSILALRLFATLASLVTIAAVYAIARRLGGRMAALLATLLCALNPFQLWYAQFARNYSLWMAASAVTVLLLLHAWRKPERPARWVPYILSAVFTGYVFYLEAFLLVAHNLFALAKVRLSEAGRRLRLLLIWAITQASIAAALAPWYLRPELFLNSREYEPNGEPANILWAIQSFLLGDTLPPPLQHPLIIQPEHSLGIASAIASFMVIVSLVLIWRTARRETFYFLAAYSLTPLAILTGLTLITGRRYFHPRYIAASSTAFILVVAFGLEGLTKLPRPSLSLRRGLSMVGAGTIAALSLVGLWNYHFNPAFS
ncbi:MAG TPA: hypothetical protein ENI95_10910, partial [Chloroflexi bacterium]|nr:hypothetical protein [Chloroflexota bacterium]